MGWETAGKSAHAVSENRICFFGTPDIIMADKDSRFVCSELRYFVMSKTPLYRWKSSEFGSY